MVVEALPSGDIGDMVPVVLPAIDVEMVPSGDSDAIMVDGIAIAMPPAMDVETVLVAVDSVGIGATVTEGAGRGGSVAG